MMQIIKIFKAELIKIAAFIFIYCCGVAHVINSSGAGIGKIVRYISENVKF